MPMSVSDVSSVQTGAERIAEYLRRGVDLPAIVREHAALLERDADNARDAERARLAGEMHDLVGHELARAALLVARWSWSRP
jgi:signal transduction histidine kinase